MSSSTPPDPVQLHPPDADRRLGFGAVRQRLVGYARTPYGRDRLETLAPSADVALVRGRLERSGQMAELVRSGEPPPLREVDRLEAVLRRVQPKDAAADGADLLQVARVLETGRQVHDYHHRRREAAPALWEIAARIAVLKSLEERIGDTIGDDGRVRDDASPELQRISRELAARQSRLRSSLLSALRDATAKGYATEDQPTIRGGRAVIPVRAEAKRKVEGFVHDVSSTGQTVYIEPASVLDLNNEIREIELERGREVRRILQALSGHVRHHRRDIERTLDAVGHLDALAAVGRLAADLDALVPEVGAGGALRLVRARHPALLLRVREARSLPDAERPPNVPDAIVPLDLELGGGAANTLVITGPNAGGKSVAMKTVGLLALMAAHGLPVPADPGTRLPLVTRLFVDLGDQQSIQDDLSTFTSHLTNVRRMLEAADDRSLCLIDEAGTGTDPAEGGALSEAVLQRLTRRGTLTVATTHIGALKAFAHNADGVENGSMEFDRETLSPTYRFRAGVPGSSYAFEIADRVGIDRPVVRDARDLVGAGKSRLEDLIAEFEERSTQAARELDEARAGRREAERVQKDYEQRLDRLRADADNRRAQALAEAERILAEANATVENTVREIKEAGAERERTQEARAKLDEARARVERRTKKVQRKQKQRAPVSAKPAPPAAAGPISVGDRVRLDDADAIGEVLELNGKEAVLALGALTSRVKLDRLTKVGGPTKQTVRVGAGRRAPGRGRRGEDTGSVAVSTAATRIDLRGARVDEALGRVQRFVDEALVGGVPSVEILHGKGTGALRQAIHDQLAGRPDVAAFAAAPPDQGGDGVTVVELA
ncbi:endonuclease MutS2 [Rubrivirga sp. S365]|uniref:endonuclease MutS2 n=1 Tax=Rubrivirga sp. S365 TaxID=3076080 RepID=UPI0028C82C69|nr:endonuclease MutS2 [Rubrivirga sp. S365]MDT7856516.1 endonuclease MutS2 [Rubrivirga sp. S365]